MRQGETHSHGVVTGPCAKRFFSGDRAFPSLTSDGDQLTKFTALCLAYFLRKCLSWKNLHLNWNAASKWRSSGDDASSWKQR